MEKERRIPPRMKQFELMKQLEKIGNIIEQMSDPDIFVWKERDDNRWMQSKGRIYGGGMHKLDPKELCNVSAEELG